MNFIKEYSRKEPIDEFVVGYPSLDGVWGDSKFKISLDAFIEGKEKFSGSIRFICRMSVFVFPG
jgi:hypothetical protein